MDDEFVILEDGEQLTINRAQRDALVNAGVIYPQDERGYFYHLVDGKSWDDVERGER